MFVKFPELIASSSTATTVTGLSLFTLVSVVLLTVTIRGFSVSSDSNPDSVNVTLIGSVPNAIFEIVHTYGLFAEPFPVRVTFSGCVPDVVSSILCSPFSSVQTAVILKLSGSASIPLNTFSIFTALVLEYSLLIVIVFPSVDTPLLLIVTSLLGTSTSFTL